MIEKKRDEEVVMPMPVLPTRPVPILTPINPAAGFQGGRPEPDFTKVQNDDFLPGLPDFRNP